MNEVAWATSPRGYWVFDLTLECYTGSHATLAWSLGIIGIVFVVILAPVFIFVQLFRHRKRFSEPAVQQYLLWLYHPYRPRFWFWEVLRMFSTFCYVATHVLGQGISLLARQLLLLLALFLYYGLLMWQQPSRFAVVTNLEVLSGFANILGLVALLVVTEGQREVVDEGSLPR